MKIDCIHFDLDSVLYIPGDFLASALMTSVKAMIQFGLKSNFDKAMDALLQIRREDSNAGDHFNRLCKRFNGTEDPIIIAAGVEKYWDSKHASMMPASNAHQVLSLLSAKYPLCVITNGIPVKQAAKLFRLHLVHYFSNYAADGTLSRCAFYATDQLKRAKPHAYLWEAAQADLGFSFKNSIMIGDRYWTDILGAKRLDMTTIKIAQGNHRHELMKDAYEKNFSGATDLFASNTQKEEIFRLMTPDYEINALAELPCLINKIEKS